MQRDFIRLRSFFAVAIIVTGVAVFEASRQPLTFDEGGYTFRMGQMESWKAFFFSDFAPETHPPLFFILYKPYFRLLYKNGWIRFSDPRQRCVTAKSRIYLRLPILSFALLALMCMPILVHKMGGGFRCGNISMALMGMNVGFIRHAYNMRMYSLLFFLATLSYIFLFSAIRSPKRLKYWIWLGIVDLALVYTHYSGIILVFSHFSALYIHAILTREYQQRSSQIRKLFFVTGIVFLLFIPWLLPFAAHVRKFVITRTANPNVGYHIITAWADSLISSPFTGQTSAWLVPVLFIGALGFLVSSKRNSGLFVFLLVLAPVVGMYVLNHWMRLGRPRYLSFLLPLIISLVTIGWERLAAPPASRFMPGGFRKYAIPVLLCLVFSLVSAQAFSIIRRPVAIGYNVALRGNEDIRAIITYIPLPRHIDIDSDGRIKKKDESKKSLRPEIRIKPVLIQIETPSAPVLLINRITDDK